MFLHADSEYSDQTDQTGRISLILMQRYYVIAPGYLLPDAYLS